MINYLDIYLEDNKGKKSETTLKNEISTLSKFFGFIGESDINGITQRMVSTYKKHMLEVERKKVTTVNAAMKRIKAFFKWAVIRQLVPVNPADEVKLIVEGESDLKWLSDDEEDLLLSSVQKEFRGSHLKESRKSYREEAMIIMLLKTGIRVSELCELKWEDVHYDKNGGVMFVRGKDNKQRQVPVIDTVAAALDIYIEKHGKRSEYVFYSKKNDNISPKTVDYIFKKFRGAENKKKGVKLHTISAHRLRHTYGHKLVMNGMPLESVARLMGHVKANGEPNIQMTIRYTKASIVEQKDLVQQILGTN